MPKRGAGGGGGGAVGHAGAAGRLNCAKCGAKAKPATLRLDGLDVRGWRCGCGESYLHPEDSERLLNLSRLRREVLRVSVTQMGASTYLRLPVELARALGLAKGDQLEIVVDGPDSLCVRRPKTFVPLAGKRRGRPPGRTNRRKEEAPAAAAAEPPAKSS